MHGHDALEGQPVVHEAKDTLFVFSAIPRAKDDSDALLNVERNRHVRVEVVLLPLVVDDGACVDDGEIGRKALEL